MNTDINLAKRTLRSSVQQRLRAVSPEQRQAGSQAICDQVLSHPAWKKSQIVLLFAPFREEPDIWPVVAAGLAAGKLVHLPKLDPAGFTFHASQVRDVVNDLAPGKFGNLEPRLTSAAMALNRLDLVLVPGVAFDAQGRRLGRGKGFYDRLLTQVSGMTCGVAFDEQIVETVPVEPHDIRLNCILTPTRLIETEGRAVFE